MASDHETPTECGMRGKHLSVIAGTGVGDEVRLGFSGRKCSFLDVAYPAKDDGLPVQQLGAAGEILVCKKMCCYG